MTDQDQIASLTEALRGRQEEVAKLAGQLARLQAAAPIQSGELLAPLLADTSPLYAWIGENGIGAAEYKRRCAAIDVIKAVAGNAVARPAPDADLMPKRAAFIAWCESRGIETVEDKDAWGKRKFQHSHVEAMWDGWFHAPDAVQAAHELTDSDIEVVWRSMPGGPAGWLKSFGYQQFAREIEAAILDGAATAKKGAQ